MNDETQTPITITTYQLMEIDRAVKIVTAAFAIDAPPTIRNQLITIAAEHLLHTTDRIRPPSPPKTGPKPADQNQQDVGVPNEAIIVSVQPEANPDLYPAILKIGPSRWKIQPTQEHVDSGPLP